jgi:outer membrane protein assembly factor BamD
MMNARRSLLGGLVLTAAACSGGFKVKNYPTPVALYTAAKAEFDKGKWDNAIVAFDQVTILLPPRDTLLPRAHFMLAQAYVRDKSYLLASATFKRLFEEFPDDTLADDALLGMADAEARVWRGPERDDQHARLAWESYSLLPRLFPNSTLVKEAEAGELRMREGLAQTDVNRGNYYVRRHMWDSALIYYRDVLAMYPNTRASRDAMLRMVEVYKRLKYMDDAGDVCKELRSAYADDAVIAKACAGIRADTTG